MKPDRAKLEKIGRMMLEALGETDQLREGIELTPTRFANAWGEWAAGYDQDPGKILREFEDGAQDYDEMVIQRDIPVYSHCEHHLAPIFGTAIVAYIPNGKVVGLSKLFRLVDAFARRLQVQERLTQQVAAALQQHVKPKGCGVVIHARHLCMESRGIHRAGIVTTTSSLQGVFRTDAAARGEFMSLIR